MSAAQLYELIFDGNNKWMLSANGTIFTYEYEAIIPGLLKRWYAERKEMQKKMLHARPKATLKAMLKTLLKAMLRHASDNVQISNFKLQFSHFTVSVANIKPTSHM